jgi:16S rRNA (cytosine967-C5)-methyltransferase
MSISPARAAAFDILLRTETQNAYAAELLHTERTEALAPADRNLCMDIVMGVLRWRSWLDHVYAPLISRPLDRVDLEVLTALRLGAYQLVFLQRVPKYAVVDESVSLTRRAKKSSAAGMVNAVLRKLTGRAVAPAYAQPEARPDAACRMLGIAEKIPAAHAAEVISSATAHPLWLVERWTAAYGIPTAAEICVHGQRIPTATIRWHGSTDFKAADAGIQLAPGALLKSARRVLSSNSGSPSYRDNPQSPFLGAGVFELARREAVAGKTPALSQTGHGGGRLVMQDEASQLVAALVGRGRRILDCCAARAGKPLSWPRGIQMRKLSPSSYIRIVRG